MGNENTGARPPPEQYLSTSHPVNGQQYPLTMSQAAVAKEVSSTPPIVVHSPGEAMGASPPPQVVYRPVPVVYSGATAELCCGGNCVMVKYPGGKCQSTCVECYGGPPLTSNATDGRSDVNGSRSRAQ